MKKILCLLLVCVCAFSIVACSSAPDFYKEFKEAAAQTSPTTVTLTVKQEQAYATLNARFVTTYAEDGSATIVYSRDVFNEIGTGTADEPISTLTGTVTCDAQGNYSDGGAFAGNSAVVSGVNFDFNKKKMNATFSTDGNVLNATVAAADTAAVLGVDFGVDVTITITKSEGKIIAFTLEYTAAEGKVYVNCVYN